MVTNNGKTPGMNCPQCGNFIPTTMVELLTSTGLTCPHCRLRLTINRNESKKAMEILQKVQNASDKLESATNFRR